MALGFNPQKSSVEYQDFTGSPPAPKAPKKMGRDNKKSHSYRMQPMGSTTATGRGLKPSKDSGSDIDIDVVLDAVEYFEGPID